MRDSVALTAAQAAERVRAGELSAGELFDAYRERAAGDEHGAYLWVAEDAPEAAAAVRELTAAARCAPGGAGLHSDG